MSADDHGTPSTYKNHGCRCGACRRAHADHQWNLRRTHLAALAAGRAPGLRHGSPNTYTNHGCRCAACTQANTEYMRRYRQRRANRPTQAKEKQ